MSQPAICPSSTTRVIQPLADIQTKAAGGHGAIREFVEKILDARDITEESLL